MVNFLDGLEGWLGWIPEWLIDIALVAFAVCVALLLHAIVMALAHRAIDQRHSLWLTVLEQTREPSRVALCVAAAAFVLPLAPLDDPLRSWLTHLMVVTWIALVGWIAIRAVDMAAGRYCGSFASTWKTICWRASMSPRWGCSSASLTR